MFPCSSRRDFLKGCAAMSAAAATPSAFAKAVRLRHDPDLTALLADIHINGKPDGEHYQPGELQKTIAEILRLDPLPSRAVFFGDLARMGGCVEDYMLARELLKPIEEAGIKLYLGMGNHDAHAPFFEVFPEYEKLTQFPGEVVFTVDAGAAKVSLHQRDFWFPIKDSLESGADHEMWRYNTQENQGLTCTFTLPRA